ncbi:MAG: enoyl-CoA hydratase/isomerase family protein [Verrucomicrobia bacterium]|nr:enoyl-CoA hydratase/isomerase family protein [Verrucomicrobiota bacterium]
MKVYFQKERSIARIALNRPEKLHALDPEMLDLLGNFVEELEQDFETRVVLLEATGDRAFCAGADINAWSGLSPVQMWATWIRKGHQVFERIAATRQPVIAVISGLAFGGGLELALAADLRLASTDSFFAMPEVKIATVPGWTGTSRLSEIIGVARAKQMILSGSPINAEIAERWGLVNEVLPKPELTERAVALAEQISMNAPLAVQTAKQIIGKSPGAVLEALAGAMNAFTADAQEGQTAFREKRAPKFQGN